MKNRLSLHFKVRPASTILLNNYVFIYNFVCEKRSELNRQLEACRIKLFYIRGDLAVCFVILGRLIILTMDLCVLDV
ncbi:hypothetical protein VCRA2116O30_20107 [Vibrio crassostreae]|nr:hypothetical protein VCRA2118O41_100106 [Vibrio crassostreae]CAK2000810.1 hypothetical protein VCRA2116O30_20107 [Vibrio crassostreae]CAK2071650.1 hypothetical protein VCRA2119O45_30108 [Vibrio crassostreae]CAK2090787.1 hypothetical protein VCRA2113O20_30210 [Vibrio crassostreae]CAK2129348.1 hypothetical protein VCRA2117O39_40107 [Vibrio crassostreae]